MYYCDDDTTAAAAVRGGAVSEWSNNWREQGPREPGYVRRRRCGAHPVHARGDGGALVNGVRNTVAGSARRDETAAAETYSF